jgi:ABC-type glutathione transport system ATPase component
MPPSEPALIALNAIRVRYAKGPPWARSHHDAVRDVDLTIRRGQTLGLVGESGSGKSTIGRICLGLLRPSAGTAAFDGQTLFGIGRRRPGALGAVLQHPEWSLDPLMTIAASVGEPLKRLTGIRPPERRERVAAMLAKVGLSAAIGERHPRELSGGQRQRAAIARALITGPGFILFDEAVSALDVSIQAQVLNMIKELQAASGFAALFISHDIAAVRYVATQIAVLYQGAIVEHAPAADFYDPMPHPYTRQLQQASGLIDDASGAHDLAPTSTGAGHVRR